MECFLGERPALDPDLTMKYCSPLGVVTTRLAAALRVRKSAPGAVDGGVGTVEQAASDRDSDRPMAAVRSFFIGPA